MRHLSRDVLLALAERSAVDPESGRHAVECARCRDEVSALARVLREVRAADVPEPSALFWDHLSARVRAAIDSEARPRRAAQDRVGGRGWPAAAVLACAVVFVVFAIAPRWAPLDTPTRVAAPARALPGAGVAAATVPDVVGWEAVLDAASGAEPASEPVELALSPVSAEHAVMELSPEEDIELARLLRQELRRPAL